MRFARDVIGSLTGTSVPERFLVTPPDLRPVSPDIARSYYHGQFTFVGQTVQAGNASPFAASPPSAEWRDALHGFRWLRHMASASGELAGAQAKTLVSDWIVNHAREQLGGPQVAGVAAMRLIAFLQHGRFLLTGADHQFYRAFMRSVAAHISNLKRDASRVTSPLKKVRVHTALGLAAICLPVNDAMAHRTEERLSAVLDEVILADGGFISRNPDDLADVVTDLLSLAKSYIALTRPIPPAVVHTLDRVLPRLRSFLHRDGELATFAGASGGKAALVAVLLESDETAARPTSQAPQSGFVSLNQGVSTLQADVGQTTTNPGMDGFQSLSALEFSHDNERVFINIGLPPANSINFLEIAQGAAAHNRLSLMHDGSDTADLRQVKLKRWPDLTSGDDGHILQYDVGLAAQTISLTRGFRLSAVGQTLEGFDRIPASALVESARLHFHTPAKTKAALASDGSVLVQTRGGQSWRVSSDCGSLSVQPSIHLAHPAGRQETVCVCITFDPAKTPTVAWRWALQT
ncbi:MAG: heparinase II/III family protein [Pseudomonadota bacterium]